MILNYADDLALQMGLKLSKASIVEGKQLGCLDCHLLHLYSDGQRVSVLIYQPELEDMQNGISSDRIYLKIRSALLRLQVLLEH